MYYDPSGNAEMVCPDKYAQWKKFKDKGYSPQEAYNEKTKELMLYTTRYDAFTEENNFIEIDRGEQYKYEKGLSVLDKIKIVYQEKA